MVMSNLFLRFSVVLGTMMLHTQLNISQHIELFKVNLNCAMDVL